MSKPIVTIDTSTHHSDNWGLEISVAVVRDDGTTREYDDVSQSSFYRVQRAQYSLAFGQDMPTVQPAGGFGTQTRRKE